MKKKPYQCPYEDISCDQLNGATLTLDCGSCCDCEHYNHGVRFSKGFYLDWRTLMWLAILATLLFLITR